MYKKTIIPQMSGMYSSFPTFTEFRNDIYLFYRQAKTSNTFVHGLHGSVKCFKISKTTLLRSFQSESSDSLYSFGEDIIVFESNENNEIDAIVSKLDNDLYSLVTRRYVPGKLNQPYISFSKTPHFEKRQPVHIDSLEWFVFYGKSFKTNEGYVFPAYGAFANTPAPCPILLLTKTGKDWSILSFIPPSDEYDLNESSIVFNGEQYIMFMRDNKPPFAIWYATSKNLKKWSKPQKLISNAHAPMAITDHRNIYLSFRDLEKEHVGATSLIQPFKENSKIVLDRYKGNIYDGGYSDLAFIDNHLFIVYYSGNEQGEPMIKGTLLKIK